MKTILKILSRGGRLLSLSKEFLKSPKDSWRASSQADVLLFSSDADRSPGVDGQAICRVLDPLAAQFEAEGYSTLSISYRGGRLVGRKTKSSVVSISRVLIRAEMRDVFRNAWTALLGLRPRTRWSATEKAYSKLFDWLRPKVILVIDADPIICSVAARLRIPVLEVLHARGYGEVYEGWRDREASELPDGVIAYDDLSTETFGRLLPTLRVPNFRLQFELEMARHFLQVSPPPFSEVPFQYRHVILFTASYNTQDPSWPGGLPSELVKLARENSAVFLLVRLHPVMRVGPQYRKARATLERELRGLPNCDLEWASTAPLYAVLHISTIHFTYDSMSAYEAADVGLPTYAINEGEAIVWPKMQDLRDRGLLIYTTTDLKTFEGILSQFPKKMAPRPLGEEISIRQIIDFAESAGKL